MIEEGMPTDNYRVAPRAREKLLSSIYLARLQILLDIRFSERP